MANTYTLIASNTLGSSAASVTFSSIPATYTDLVLKMSVRGSDSVVLLPFLLRINGVTTTSYSYTNVYGQGSTVTSSRSASDNNMGLYDNGATSTSNTFANIEVYIPSYTASQNKPIGATIAVEHNSTTTNRIDAQATLFSNTSAITSIELSNQSTYTFNSGSSFFLYGIKNS
jgi:hypothetical protein